MTTVQAPAELGYKELPLSRLEPHPHNPRGTVPEDSVAALAASIAAQGVLVPLLVRPLGDRFQVVHGHRRLAAARVARLSSVPVIVRPMEDGAVLLAQLAENKDRPDLNALQEAEGYARYLKTTGATQEQLATSLGLTQGTISAALALLDLPDAGRKLVEAGILTAAHGRELGRLTNHPQQLGSVLGWLRSAGQRGDRPSSRAVRGWVDDELRRLEEDRRDRERAAREKVEAAKLKAEGLKTGKAKRSAAEAKAAAAKSLASRISRERHLEIAVRATAIAKEAVALGKRWKVPAGAVLAAAQACNVDRVPTLGWSQRDLTYDTTRTLQVALVGRVPGKWRRHGSTDTPLDAHDALDATAAQAWLGVWTWLVTRTKGLEAQLDAAAKRRLAAKAKAKARK